MNDISSPFSYPLAGFCAVAAFVMLLGVAVTTIRLSRNVADIARAEGSEWRFLKDRRQLFRFVYQPEDLLHSSDSHRLSDAKRILIAHRKQLIRSVAAAPLLLCIGFGLTTPFPFYCLVIAIIAMLMLLVRGIL